MRRALACLVCSAVLALTPTARAAWVVDAGGACIERWQSEDLLRGPTAIVNAPLLPLRTLAGGAEYAWNTEEWWPYQIAILGPAATLFAGAAGAVEATWWVLTGLADTLTGGAFALAPDGATELSLAPKIPAMLADAHPTPATDPCGRPLTPSPAPSPTPVP